MLSQIHFARRSRICFSTFVSRLILAFELSIQFEFEFKFNTVIGIQGLSLDSTHTEPYAYKAQFLGQQTFAEFFTTALQHNLVGQGRFRGLLLRAS